DLPTPRHLHSFPTRRSSDLAPRIHSGGCVRARVPRLCFFVTSRKTRSPYTAVVSTCGRGRTRNSHSVLRSRPILICSRRQGRSRSEEHTSELQSRFDLVCRL